MPVANQTVEDHEDSAAVLANSIFSSVFNLIDPSSSKTVQTHQATLV